jgi:hypothetical protein
MMAFVGATFLFHYLHNKVTDSWAMESEEVSGYYPLLKSLNRTITSIHLL